MHALNFALSDTPRVSADAVDGRFRHGVDDVAATVVATARCNIHAERKGRWGKLDGPIDTPVPHRVT